MTNLGAEKNYNIYQIPMSKLKFQITA